MVITEIFKSIQGEGTRAGLPCIFVRLTGCNLRCTWCDTAYAFHGGTKYSLDEILEKVQRARRRWRRPRFARRNHRRRAVAAAGNPGARGKAARRRLHRDDRDERRTVRGDTASQRNQDRGREMSRFRRSRTHSTWRTSRPSVANDEIKFVIASRRDYDFARDFTAQHRLARARPPGACFRRCFPTRPARGRD